MISKVRHPRGHSLYLEPPPCCEEWTGVNKPAGPVEPSTQEWGPAWSEDQPSTKSYPSRDPKRDKHW